MGQSRDLFIEMMEKLWNNSWMDDLTELRNLSKRKNTTEETMEFTKGNYKTSLTVYFDEKGKYAGVRAHSEYIPTEDEERINKIMTLKKEKEQALKKEDYIRAAEIRDQLKELETNNKG